jgi:hypothetical protein
VPLCIPPPRVGDLSKRVDQGHVSSLGRHGRIQISPRGKPYSSNAIPLLEAGVPVARQSAEMVGVSPIAEFLADWGERHPERLVDGGPV